MQASQRFVVQLGEAPSWWSIWKTVEKEIQKSIKIKPFPTYGHLTKEELETLGAKLALRPLTTMTAQT